LLIQTTLKVDDGKENEDLGKGVFAEAGNVSFGTSTLAVVLERLACNIMLVK
jgi:hypothetical protein